MPRQRRPVGPNTQKHEFLVVRFPDTATISMNVLNVIQDPMNDLPNKFELFYDGDCPLCRREIAIVRRMDRQNRVKFTDIANPHFSAESTGRSVQQLMDEIHGRRSDGTWLVGVAAFRELYSTIGFGAMVWPTRLPVISHALEIGYRWFAKRRLWLTGRCDDFCHVSAKTRTGGTS